MKVVLWAKTEKGKDAAGKEGPPSVVLFKKGVAPMGGGRAHVETEERVVVLHGMRLPSDLEGKAVEADLSEKITGMGREFTVSIQGTTKIPDEPELLKIQEVLTPEQKKEKGKHFGMGMKGGQLVGNVKKPSMGMPPIPAGASRAKPGAGMKNTSGRRKQRGGPNQGMRSFRRTPKAQPEKKEE